MEMFLCCVNMQELLSIKYQLQGESFKMAKDEPEVVLVYTPGAGAQLEWPGQAGSCPHTDFARPWLVSVAAAPKNSCRKV